VPQPTHLPDVWSQARALRDRGDLASARMLLEDSLDVATFQYGEDHPDVLVTSHLLAALYRRAGDLPAARRLLEEALQAGSGRLPESDPVLLRMTFELAGIVDALGNRHEARRHYTRVARFGPAAEGLDDQVREAVGWLGPPAQPHSPAPGVVAVTPELPQRVPQERPVMAGPPPAPPTPEAPPAEPPAPEPPSEVRHAPLPSLSGPVRFADRPAEPEPEGEPAYQPAPPKIEAPPPAPVFTAAPSVIVERRGRGAVFLAAAAAVVAVLAAVFVVMLILGRPGAPAETPAQQESQGTELPSHGPATGVTITDHGGSVTVRWNDPAQQRAGFAVKMGATKDSLTLVTGNLGSKPTFTITGLNAKYNYCFSVVTIYSGTELRDSEAVCTARSSAVPSGSR
jgi:Tetratricopeptide repeat